MGASAQVGTPVSRRVLLAQTSFLGDVVLTTALARTIAAAWPDAEIWWLVRPEASALLEPTYGSTRVLAFDKRGAQSGVRGVLAMARTLSALRFDVAVGVQRSLRTAALLARAGIPRRVGFAGSAGAWLYHRRVTKAGNHARDRLVGLAAGLEIAVPSDAPTPHLDVAEESICRVDGRLAAESVGAEEEIVVVAPGSAWATKQWPAKRFGEAAARLCREGRDRVVVIGTPADGAQAAEIAQVVEESGGKTIDATGGTSIGDAVAWIARARLVLANDSAPAHIAAALSRPVVATFGPTVPAQGFAPLGDRVRIVERDLDCRPCSRHGGDRCPIGTHECLAELPAAEVVTAAESLLGERVDRGRS